MNPREAHEKIEKILDQLLDRIDMLATSGSAEDLAQLSDTLYNVLYVRDNL